MRCGRSWRLGRRRPRSGLRTLPQPQPLPRVRPCPRCSPQPRREPRDGCALPGPAGCSGAGPAESPVHRAGPAESPVYRAGPAAPALPCPGPQRRARARPRFPPLVPLFPGRRVRSPEEQPGLAGCSCVKLWLCPPILYDSRSGGSVPRLPQPEPALHYRMWKHSAGFFFFVLYLVFGTTESELWRLSEKLVQVRAMSFSSGQYPLFFCLDGR